MGLEELIGGLAWTLAALLLLAILHKLRILRDGQAAAEPLVTLSPWRRRHAAILLALSAGAELALAVALIVMPEVGLAGSAVLTAFYASQLLRLPANRPCNCFGAALNVTTRRAAIARNLGLAVLTGAAAGLVSVGAVDVVTLSATALGIASIPLAAIVAVLLLDRVGGPSGPRVADR